MTHSNIPDVKICGIKDTLSIEAAAHCGAHFLGFVFYADSPRAIDSHDAALLLEAVPDHMETVGLFVDANDEAIEEVLSNVTLDLLQLHGNESPERVNKVSKTFSLPVIKAIRIADKDDLATVVEYDGHCDFILFDTKVNGLAGGTGKSFDWNLLKDMELATPWILSGGLDAQNIGTALSFLEPVIVDVSSGVEDAPGKKNPNKIKEFIDEAQKSR